MNAFLKTIMSALIKGEHGHGYTEFDTHAEAWEILVLLEGKGAECTLITMGNGFGLDVFF
jgi:hypothetical protein